MFTGIIEGVGRLAARESIGGDVRFTFNVGNLPFDNVQMGESIAINGVCLTVIAFDARSFRADASTETLGLTTLGQLGEGAVINPSAPCARPTASAAIWSAATSTASAVLSIHEDARAQRWRFAAPASLRRYIAGRVRSAWTASASPSTKWTMKALKSPSFRTPWPTPPSATGVGSAVNLEIDLVARYVERLISVPTNGQHPHGDAA